MNRRFVVAAWVVASVLGGCGRGDQARRDTLEPVALPDLSRADPIVQQQARDRHAALQALIAQKPPAERLAVAYGEMGMLFHAAELLDAAEPAYVNAETLAPTDVRWPYYLARVYTAQGQRDRAVVAYNRALALSPDDVPLLIRLGRLYLDQGQPAQAEPLFERARAASPQSVAALAGLGQSALARRDFARATQHLEAAIALDPNAASVHAPLAQAYRGLGDLARAQAHLDRWRNSEIAVPDARDDQLRMMLQSGMAYESRGVTAFEAGRYAEAVDLFRAGLAVTAPASPVGRSLRHKLGLALHLSGNEEAAFREFEEAVRLAPANGIDEPAARAHYGLGVIHAGRGRGPAAIEHLRKAVSYDPRYVQARVVLGDALIESGRVAEGAEHLREAVAIEPRAVPARLGYARALVSLGRVADARAWLEEGIRVLPDRPELRQMLSRLPAGRPQ